MIKVFLLLISSSSFLVIYPSQQVPDENINFTIPTVLQIVALKKTSPTNPTPEPQHVPQQQHRRSSSGSGKIQTQGPRNTSSPEQEQNTRRMSK